MFFLFHKIKGKFFPDTNPYLPPVKKELITEGIKTTHDEVLISSRNRGRINSFKVAVINDLFTIIADEDLDKFLLQILSLADELGYKLQNSPEELITQINNGRFNV